MDFLTTKEIATKWNITSRRVSKLCKEGRIIGAELKGNTWLIPITAEKPTELKRGPKKIVK